MPSATMDVEEAAVELALSLKRLRARLRAEARPSEGWTIMASPGHPASFGDAYYHFVLTGSGSDPDAGDALTYTWEEVDASSSAYDPVC